MFNHGNIRPPLNVARLLRLMLVTPDMHRVYHSVVIKETNSNFGFNFPSNIKKEKQLLLRIAATSIQSKHFPTIQDS
jgi:hypothetical protein